MAPVGSIAEPVEVPMVQVETGQRHSLEVLEEGTMVIEARDETYESLSVE